MRKSNLLLGTIAAIGTLGTAGFGYAWRAQSARVAGLERELATQAAARIRRDEVVAPKRAADPDPRATRAAIQTQPSTAMPEPANRVTVTDPLQSWQQRERSMLEDPDYRRSQIAQGRRRFATVRADAIRVAGMTPEQADRMVDLWIERNLRFTELGATGGQPPSDEARAALTRAGEAEQAELRDLLGEERYARWNRYLQSGEERAEVGLLRAQLANSAAALTESQVDALVEAIYTERQQRSAEYEEYVKAAGITDRYVVSPQDRQRWLDLEKEANGRIHAAMTTSLSAAQLSALDDSLAARLAPIEAALRLQLAGRPAKPD
jgi:hypothetical protein